MKDSSWAKIGFIVCDEWQTAPVQTALGAMEMGLCGGGGGGGLYIVYIVHGKGFHLVVGDLAVGFVYLVPPF